MDVRVGLWRRLGVEELMLLNCGVGEDSWESLGLQGDPTSPFWRRSALGFLWKNCQSWNSSTLATSCKELTHWKRVWGWEALGAGGEGDYRGWDGWMASLTRCTWVWVNSGSWWWTGRPGVQRFMGSQRVGHDWVTERNWTDWEVNVWWNKLGFKSDFILRDCFYSITNLYIYWNLTMYRKFTHSVRESEVHQTLWSLDPKHSKRRHGHWHKAQHKNAKTRTYTETLRCAD